jgi:hypothetical protein
MLVNNKPFRFSSYQQSDATLIDAVLLTQPWLPTYIARRNHRSQALQISDFRKDWKTYVYAICRGWMGQPQSVCFGRGEYAPTRANTRKSEGKYTVRCSKRLAFPTKLGPVEH